MTFPSLHGHLARHVGHVSGQPHRHVGGDGRGRVGKLDPELGHSSKDVGVVHRAHPPTTPALRGEHVCLETASRARCRRIARRSISLRPPQIPWVSRILRAYSRHSSRTGHERRWPWRPPRERPSRSVLEIAGREEVRGVLASAGGAVLPRDRQVVRACLPGCSYAAGFGIRSNHGRQGPSHEIATSGPRRDRRVRGLRRRWDRRRLPPRRARPRPPPAG